MKYLLIYKVMIKQRLQNYYSSAIFAIIAAGNELYTFIGGNPKFLIYNPIREWLIDSVSVYAYMMEIANNRFTQYIVKLQSGLLSGTKRVRKRQRNDIPSNF